MTKEITSLTTHFQIIGSAAKKMAEEFQALRNEIDELLEIQRKQTLFKRTVFLTVTALIILTLLVR